MWDRDVDIAPLWMIGCGNMGGTILERWITAGLDPSDVTVITRTPAAVSKNVRNLHSVPQGEQPQTLVLAVKPQQLAAVAPRLAAIRPAVIVSILAGVKLQAISTTADSTAVIRLMPNLATSVGRGTSTLIASNDAPFVREIAECLAAPLGCFEWIDDEGQFDIATALAGSGPAFVFRFADTLAAAGAELGLAHEQAMRLALSTLEGSAILALNADDNPGDLADRVASKGGSTREGLNILDDRDALKNLMTAAVKAAAQRNYEMGLEFSGPATPPKGESG